MVRRCGCSARLVWAYGCGRRSCARCSISKCAASATRLFERVYDGEEIRLQALVLTVPVEERHRFEGAEGAGRWAQVLRGFVVELRESFGFRWAYVRSHPRGDESRDFAPHANLLGAQSLRCGRLDVDALRRSWAAALGCPGATVNLHASYFDLTDFAGVASFKHWCAYVERAFPGWSWAGQWARWYGERPKMLPIIEVADKGKCPKCGEHHSYEEPAGADVLAIAGLEAFLDRGDPIPPAEAARWSRLDPRPPPPPRQPLSEWRAPERAVTQGWLF